MNLQVLVKVSIKWVCLLSFLEALRRTMALTLVFKDCLSLGETKKVLVIVAAARGSNSWEFHTA